VRPLSGNTAILQRMLPPQARGARVKSARVTPTRPLLPREFVAVHKRKRIMDAIAELSAEHGYEATSIGDIVRRAGVARKTLYDNFEGKEEVFLTALDAAVAEALSRTEAGCQAAGEDWQDRVEAGLTALLTYVAEEPAGARMCVIEALSATPASSKRYDEALAQFVELLRQNVPVDSGLPETLPESLVGGVAWILNQKIRRGEAEGALELLEELSEFVLSPYQGVAGSKP
jgi:AcrR family transcriptional regulator